MPLSVILVILGFLVVFSAFISASETAVVGVSKLKLRHLLSKGVRGAKSVQSLSGDIDRFITAILVTNNLVNITMSSLVTAMMVGIFGFRWGVLIATLSSTLGILVLCEITPKILALKYTERMALIAAPLWVVLVRWLKPVISLFAGTSAVILKVFGLGRPKRSPLITEEELRLMIEIGKEEGVLSDEEKRMLHRIFDFGNIPVSSVMVPKDKVIAINVDSSVDAVMDVFVEEGYARLPVYQGAVDNITGIVYAKDLLYLVKEKGLVIMQDIIQEISRIPETMKVNDLLRKFQAEKIQVAVVTGADGSTRGLVTLEDLMEEIVGELEEKRNRPKRRVR
jgi:putative hemolysin